MRSCQAARVEASHLRIHPPSSVVRAALPLFVLLLGGCASARPAPEPTGLAAAQRLFDGRTADVVLADGSVLRAAALRIEADETSWLAAGEVARVPTCAVASIRRVARRRPPGRGLVAMGAAGAVAGAVLGGTTGCGLGDGNASCAAASAALLGGIGALVGLGLDAASTPPEARVGRVTLAPTCTATVRTVPLTDEPASR